ncbi:MAG: S8 family serine peptidase [Candidatus Cloacimonetes bacterium]|nr:S8 family serine peptidase [Candidatus Cloacimonadota bacterium]
MSFKGDLMKTVLLVFFLTLFSLTISWAYEVQFGERPEIDLTRVSDDAFHQTHILIQFSSDLTGHLDNNPVRYDRDGYAIFDLPEIDELNRYFSVKEVKPLFDSPALDNEYKDRHRAWGFHLWYELYFSEKQDIREAVAAYKELEFIEVAEPEYKKVRYFAEDRDDPTYRWTPNDPYFSTQWHYHNTGQQSGTPGADIKLVTAWDIEKGHTAVIVAIIDGGIQTNHPDIAANMWSGIGYNFVDNNTTITADDHGTHVAGTVSAVNNNGVGVAGVAGGSGSGNGVRLMTCQVFRGISQGGFSTAPVWAADNGAAISQNSWGYQNSGVYNTPDLNAIDYFNANGGGTVLNGGITIFAAGNDDDNGAWYPGYYSGAFSVAATTNTDTKAYYSNYGTWIDVSAPGGEVISVAARGVRSTIAGSSYAYYQGTSMACPHVSGVAALVVSYAHRNGFTLNNSNIKNILRDSTDNHYGVNPGYTGQLGTGRLNAHAALVETMTYIGLGVPNPQSFTATSAGLHQINLNWVKNTDNNNVMVAWSATGTFGTPVDGTVYSAGTNIPGGGTVLYRGSATSYNHTGLNSWTTYYYRAFSYNSSNEYSSGLNAQATTLYEPFTLPFSENFNASTTLPDFWQIIDHQGNGQVWQFGTTSGGLSGTTGNYAYLNSDAYGSGNTQNADLVTPTLDLSNNYNVNLSFTHYFRQYQNVSTATLSYSINNGTTWTTIQSWTSTTGNPVYFSQTIPALEGQSQVKFKWNYTGTWGYYWCVDDILITGDEYVLLPTIDVTPVSFFEELNTGEFTTEQMTISNDGEADLEYSISVVETRRANTDDSFMHIDGAADQTTRGITEIHYDNGYSGNGVGAGGAAYWISAVRFTADELAAYYGDYQILGIKYHIRTSQFTNVTVKVWEGGSSGNSGTEIYSQDVTSSVVINDWSTHILTTPVSLITGNEYWIGYSINATGGSPASIDSGPLVANKGGWIYWSNSWTQITAFGFNTNWCIRGLLYDSSGSWLSVSPISGIVQPGQSEIVDVSFVSIGLPAGSVHTADIVIANNAGADVVVPATLSIFGMVLNPPSNLSAVAGDGVVNLSWDAPLVRSLLGYNVYRNGVQINPEIVIGTEYPDNTVVNGTTYSYYVTAVYTEGESEASNIVQATPLAAPINLSAVPGAGSVFLDWDAPPIRTLLSYNIYRNGSYINNVTTPETEYTDSGLGNGVTYSYYVTAVYQTHGESVPSNTVEVTTLQGTVAAPTFNPPQQAEPFYQEFTVTISSATPAATIWYKTAEGNDWTAGNSVNITQNTEIWAMATRNNWADSEISYASYELKVVTPTFDPVEQGTPFDEPIDLELITTTSGATILYRIISSDGVRREEWQEYIDPIYLFYNSYIELETKAIKAGWLESDIAYGYFAVNPGQAGIMISNLEQIYSSEPLIVSVTTNPTGLDYIVTYNGSPELPVNVGNYLVEVTIDDPYYEGTEQALLQIFPFDITVTANPQSKTYGEADPLFTYSVDPVLFAGDGFTGTLTRQLGENVGQYEILQGTLTAGDNYRITYNSDYLTISPATAAIEIYDLSQVYGSVDDVTVVTTPLGLNYTVTYDGSPTLPVNVGTYEVEVVINELNYVGSETAWLVIDPLAITVTADPQTKIYGEADPVLTYGVNPALIVGDSFTGSLTRQLGEDVGQYEILLGTLTAGDNYTISYVSDYLTISPATATIEIYDLSQIYGSVGDVTVVTTPLGLNYTVTYDGSPTLPVNVGTYEVEVVINELNYVGSETAWLVIDPLAITVTADPQTKIYGEADPEFTYQYSPLLVEGDTIVGELSRAIGEDVGQYEILQGTLTAGANYTIIYQSDYLTISPMAITVTADPQSKVYGEEDPPLTYTVEPELIAGDQFSGSLVREVGEEVGEYQILQGTLSAGDNYSINYIPNVFEILSMVDLSAPVVTISIESNTVILSWEHITGANSYKIYSTGDPYVPEEEWDLAGTTANNEFTEPLTTRKFYRVIASTEMPE